MEISDRSKSSLHMILDRNDDLLAFYNRSTMDSIDKTTSSIESQDLFFNDENNKYNNVHLSLEKEGKTENRHVSTTAINDRSKTVTTKKDTGREDKTIRCCCRGGQTKTKNKTDHNGLNHIELHNTPTKYQNIEMGTLSNLTDEVVISIPVPKTGRVANLSTTPPQGIKTALHQTEHIEMKDATSDRNEINIHQQSTMINSSLIDHNYNISKSSIDLQNLFNDKIPSLPMHSRCLVLFEFANREEHVVETAELPRSSHRVSRLGTYEKIRERLTLTNLIDIDLTALLRTLLQSFP